MNSFCGRRRDFWLVFVARARGTHEGKRKPTLLFSPPVCVRARPRNLALRLKKIRLRSPGGGVFISDFKCVSESLFTG